ncbi:unnamed protein product, partial [Closterium sp. Naga37s-1]
RIRRVGHGARSHIQRAAHNPPPRTLRRGQADHHGRVCLQQLTLVNLSFQLGRGVFYKVLTAINARLCDFSSNTEPNYGGGVLSESFPATAAPGSLPTRLFTSCTFVRNTALSLGGGAVSINAGKSTGQVPDLRFNNKAFGSYPASPYLKAGYGGTVYAISTQPAQAMALRFCSSSFSSSGGVYEDGPTLAVQNMPDVQSRGEVALCGWSGPAGLVVPTSGWSVLSNCPNSWENGEQWVRRWGGSAVGAMGAVCGLAGLVVPRVGGGRMGSQWVAGAWEASAQPGEGEGQLGN